MRSLFLISCLLFAMLIPLPARCAPLPEITTPAPEEIRRVAALLPERPAGLGRPASDRTAWEALARRPESQATIRRGERTLQTPMPELTDDIYLEYSRTGKSARAREVILARRDRVGRLVEAECFEAKGRFIPDLENTLRAICAEKTWVNPSHDGDLRNFSGRVVDIDLYSATFAWDLGTALYLLGDRLSPAVRDLARRELDRRIFAPFRSMVERHEKYNIQWLMAPYNWNSICLAGCVGAALAVIESREERAFFVAVAEKSSVYTLETYTDDGFSVEGLDYWNHGFGFYIKLAELLRQATGNQIDILDRPRAIAAAGFGARFEILGGVYPAFADCTLNTRPDARLVQFANRLLGPPASSPASPADSAIPHSAFRIPHSIEWTGGLISDLIYHFPNSADNPPPLTAPLPDADPARRTWFDRAGILISRPGPSSCRIGAAMMAGGNGDNHNHNDVGTFVLALGGIPIVADPGREQYTSRTFNHKTRYLSKVINSFGHCVPLVAGRLQDEGPQARGVVLKTGFTPERDTFVIDLRSAYTVPSLQSLTREFVFSRAGAGSLTVTDEARFSQPEAFETALITFGQWKQTASGALRIEDRGQALNVTASSPSGPIEFSSEILDETLDGIPDKPTRIAIRLADPAASAIIILQLSPE